MLIRYTVFAFFLAVALVVTVSLNAPATGAAPLPESDDTAGKLIKFSHRYHIEELATECVACHPNAATSKFSSDNLLSTKADCATCHDVDDPDDCMKCHVDLSNPGTLSAPKRELIFSHDVHVAGQNMQCETCHQGLDRVDYGGPQTMPAMASCTTCHNDQKVTNLCESCHTDFVTLIPPDHKQSNFLRNHKDVTRLGALATDCQTCHREDNFCQQCHQVNELKSFGRTRRDLAVEPGPRRSTRDSKNQMSLQNVHELNYRFTHGIDTKSRQSDCTSCHSLETFCADCHSAGGNITQIRFKPASHLVPGFTTLGRGSGGGLHAQEARRDMEQCVSCHNVEAREPTCMTCHTDDGRVR
jgi:hypothetical protein